MCLLKKVLSLTKKCDANKWVEVEQLVLKNVSSLDKSSTVQVSRHFGQNSQGSANFWKGMENKTLQHFDELNAQDLTNVLEGFGSAPYRVSSEFNDKMISSLDYICEQVLAQKSQQDPYFQSEIMKNLLFSQQNASERLQTQEKLEGESQKFFVEFQDETKTLAQQSEALSTGNDDKKVIDGFSSVFPELKKRFSLFNILKGKE